MQKDGALLHGRVGALLTAGTSDSKSLSLLSSYMYSVVSIVLGGRCLLDVMTAGIPA